MNSKKLTFGRVERKANSQREILEQVQETRESNIGTRDENCIVSIFNVGEMMVGGMGPRGVAKDGLEDGVKVRWSNFLIWPQKR